MNLFDSFQIRDISFRNRIAVSPMCEYSSEDGFANDWHLVHLGARAVGGAGTILTEATAVVSEGRISPSDLGIWKDAHVENLARVVRFLRQHGAVAGTQLAHAGFKASTGAPWRNHGAPVPIADGGWRPIYSSTAKGFTPELSPPKASHGSPTLSQRALAAASKPASNSSKSTEPTATSSTSSSRRWSTPEPTSTAVALRTAPASCARSSKPSAKSGPNVSPCGSASPPRTGPRAAHV